MILESTVDLSLLSRTFGRVREIKDLPARIPAHILFHDLDLLHLEEGADKVNVRFGDVPVGLAEIEHMTSAEYLRLKVPSGIPLL